MYKNGHRYPQASGTVVLGPGGPKARGPEGQGTKESMARDQKGSKRVQRARGHRDQREPLWIPPTFSDSGFAMRCFLAVMKDLLLKCLKCLHPPLP